MTALTWFTGSSTLTVGNINMPVYVGWTTRIVKFVVIDKPAIHNVILGTPWIHSIRAVTPTYHQCLKFPTTSRIYPVWGDQKMSELVS